MKKVIKVAERWLPRVALLLVILEPILSWLVSAFQSSEFVLKNPYTTWDVHLVLIFCILNVIYSEMIREKTVIGDESNILLNRNQSDYYEIWEACKKNRTVSIEAYGHSFKTLWFNFIQKFLNEVVINSNHYDKVSVILVSTRRGKNCFSDISSFYNGLAPELAKKIDIKLVEVDEMTFFTGICVNSDYLWLSIREPHRANKSNEHVREWTRKNNDTSAKMLDWFLGIIRYYLDKESVISLEYKG